jgi:hypothetical protein
VSDKLLAAGVAVILGVGAAAGAILILEALDRPAPIAAAPPDPQLLLVGIPHGGRAPRPVAPAPAAIAPVDEEVILIQTAITLADQVARPAIAGTLHVAADAIRTGTINLAAPYEPPTYDRANVFDASFDAVMSPPTSLADARESAASVLDAASGDVLGVSKLAVDAGVKLVGLRGATEDQQEAILANTALSTVQGALNAIPVFGTVLSLGLGILAGTYEGQQVLADVGTALQDAYDFQRELLAGDAKGALGLDSGRRDRLRRLLQAVRETQPVNDPRYLAAQDAAARGAYAGELKGTELDRFDATLRVESTLNAAALEEARIATEELAARNAANTAATIAANEAYIAAGLFTQADQLRQDLMAATFTLNASRNAAWHMLEQSFARRTYTWSGWKTTFDYAAMNAARAEFDAETKRMLDALTADYAARIAAVQPLQEVNP